MYHHGLTEFAQILPPLLQLAAAPSTYQPELVGPLKVMRSANVSVSANGTGTVTLPLYLGQIKEGSNLTKKKLRRVAVDQEYVELAPVLIIVCSNTSRSTNRYGIRGREFYSIRISGDVNMFP
jgi:hypothetical protein